MQATQPVRSVDLAQDYHTVEPHEARDRVVHESVEVARDRVRWGPIIAGLFAALSTLAVLGTLGSAIGASAYDPGDSARNFGVGAGIWGIISVLLAFALGGWLAARTAAVRGHDNGLLNGAMVWVVAIPVMAYVLAGVLGSAVSTAVDATGSAAVTASNVDRSRGAGGDTSGQDISDQARQASARIGESARNVDTDRVAARTARSAWATLAGLLLSFGAASLGGYMGARTDRVRTTV